MTKRDLIALLTRHGGDDDEVLFNFYTPDDTEVVMTADGIDEASTEGRCCVNLRQVAP